MVDKRNIGIDKRKAAGADKRKTGGQPASAHGKLSALGLDHARVLFFSLGRLYRAPVASLITMLVIGIALALPAGVYVLLLNFKTLTAGWEEAAQISLFLHNAPDSLVEQIATEVIARPEVERVEIVTAEQALAEFREQSGFGDALDALDENPLPPVLIVMPAPEHRDRASLERLVEEFGAHTRVELAQLDMEWLLRLRSLIALVHRGLVALAAILGVAVLLIVGNTIRLDIQNHRAEIEVTKLIGGTDGFIRRPFLYAGFWYGLIGGVLAWLLVFVALSVIAGPAKQLSGLYASSYELIGLSATNSLTLLGLGALLGTLGSWFAVARHLSEIQPS